MPEIIIVAGPNGAGKTSFANQYLRDEEGIAFVNADEIARSLAAESHPQAELDVRAGRFMLQQIDALTAASADFMFETTLSSLNYARRIPDWQARSYRVGLVYLRLPNVEASIQRVARRVADGGHAIPEEVIRRRFGRSLACLEGYKDVVDEWYIFDSLEGDFTVVETWDNRWIGS